MDSAFSVMNDFFVVILDIHIRFDTRLFIIRSERISLWDWIGFARRFIEGIRVRSVKLWENSDDRKN